MYYSAWDEVRRAQKLRSERVERIEDALGKFYEEFEQFKGDTNARIEELEIDSGFLNGEDEDVDTRVGRAVEAGFQDSERRNRRRAPTAVMDDGREEAQEYEDPTPSFVGRDGESGEVMYQGEGCCWAATHLCDTRLGLEAYVDRDDYYWITTPDLRHGSVNGVCIADPDALRILADKIEGAKR